MRSVHDFMKMKQSDKKISMITCYDYSSAKIVDKTNIDCVLVGDSLAMVMHGFNDTTSATVELMAIHTRSVSRGIKTKFIIADMPFMSYRKSISITMDTVEVLIQAGANAVKLEGCEGNLQTISHIVESGVPVMGHIGLTPQHIHAMGGFKVQGRSKEAYEDLLLQAKQLESAGCFSIVLECIPAELAQEITGNLTIPTIGIGAGLDTNGQVLVFHDLLGFQKEFKPKFLKAYCNTEELFIKNINQYVGEVHETLFPSDEHAY